MAKLYREKRVSTACKVRMGGRLLTDYEAGHRLWQARHPLPHSASKLMCEGHANGAREEWEYYISQIREAYRKGALSIIPRYESLVRGIEPLTTSPATFPLKRGSKDAKWALGRARNSLAHV